MKRTTLLLIYMSVGMLVAAQSSYLPRSWSTSADANGTIYSEGSNHYYKHTKSSTHFDVYYGTGYGSTPPEKLASSNALYVDVDDLLKKAETFFDLNVNKLKFANLSTYSKLNQYKMIICLLHDTGWTATGSGYDNQVGALWVTPSTCKPVGHTIAHEIGHSFQYQCFSDLGGYAGFRYANGNGSAFWEQTAQWQAANAYPNQMISESIGLWQHNHNYAFTHEWQRYQSYWLHYYWADKHGIDAVARVWRGGTVNGEDPCQVYMRVFGVSAHDFYKEIYDYASKMATYDIDAIRSYGAGSIGQYTYSFVDTPDGKIQVAYSSCPQSTGFNVIPLDVPSAGTTIKTIFTALPPGRAELAEGDKKQYHNGSTFTSIDVTKYNSFSGSNYRGFRHGYVALLSNGKRVYQSVDTVYAVATTTAQRYRAMNDTTTFVVPEGTQRLFFIVAPAPTQYIVHNWDENITNDDQWPYQLEFEGTDIVGHMPTVDLSDTNILPGNTTLDIYVGFNATTGNDYSGTTYNLSARELRAIGEALRVQPANIGGLIRSYSASQANNTIQLLALNPQTGEVVNSGTTSRSSNGTGHWFNSSGSVCSWGNTAYVYSELDNSTLMFTIGQYPGRCSNGQVYTVGQAFRYKDSNGKVGVAKLKFHIYIGGVPTGVTDIRRDEATEPKNIYDLTGRGFGSDEALHPGIYIINSRKILVK